MSKLFRNIAKPFSEWNINKLTGLIAIIFNSEELSKKMVVLIIFDEVINDMVKTDSLKVKDHSQS